NLNHILTIKHLRITVGEYTYGLPRFFGIVGHGIQPIKYRMLKRMDSFSLLAANLWNSCSQNNNPEVSFKLLYNVSRDNLNYDQVSYIYNDIETIIHLLACLFKALSSSRYCFHIVKMSKQF